MLKILTAVTTCLLLSAAICSPAAMAATATTAENDAATKTDAHKPKTEAVPAPIMTSILGIEPLKVYRLPFDDDYPSGPFEILADKQFLFISKCGQVYFTRLDSELKLIKPVSHLSKNTSTKDTGNPVYCKEFTGVKDSLLQGNALYVAYTVWNDKQNAIQLAVSEFAVDLENATLTFKRNIYLTQPAIKEPILGNQVGGKLVLGENDHTLFLSVGDFSRAEFVQDKQTSLGKVIRIDLRTLKAEVYATGIRSPSGGLFYDRKSHELWLTDHGPHGGDEINLIRKGKNYGWPLVSYGTMYERGGMGNYYGNAFNTHEGYEKPAMTFVPSIGIGPIARYPASGKNEYWENDYFVAGMGATTLLRIRKEGSKLVYAEPVLTGYRIRAIKIDRHGDFYLKTDNNQLLLSDPSKKRMP